jgi:molecular chaperone GrpE
LPSSLFSQSQQGEKDQLAISVRGDVVNSLLPVIDAFELARTQVKAETEGEMKINNSYQGLYKQVGF